jgi:hypothetical protein
MAYRRLRRQRRLLEIVCLNCRLGDVTLVPEITKPFDVLAEGLVSENSRGDMTAIEPFIVGLRAWKAGIIRRIDDGSLSSG